MFKVPIVVGLFFKVFHESVPGDGAGARGPRGAREGGAAAPPLISGAGAGAGGDNPT